MCVISKCVVSPMGLYQNTWFLSKDIQSLELDNNEDWPVMSFHILYT